MTHPINSGDGTYSNGTIAVSPGTWSNASHPVKIGNSASDDIKAAVLITLNGLIDGLGDFSYMQGAINLARAISDFSSNIEFSLGCIAVDLNVVSSGLEAAAQAFASLDSSLAATFASLEAQMAYFTTDTTLTTATVATYSPLKVGNEGENGWNELGHYGSQAWHYIMEGGKVAYRLTVLYSELTGLPPWAAEIIGGAVVVLYVGVVAIGLIEIGGIVFGAALAG